MTDRTVKTHLWVIAILFALLASLFFVQSQPNFWSYGALVFTSSYLSLFSLLPLVFFFSQLGGGQNKVLSFLLLLSSFILKLFFLSVLYWLVLIRFKEFAFSMLLFVIAAGAVFVGVFVSTHFYMVGLDKRA
jgi:hypothetical protein